MDLTKTYRTYRENLKVDLSSALLPDRLVVSVKYASNLFAVLRRSGVSTCRKGRCDFVDHSFRASPTGHAPTQMLGVSVEWRSFDDPGPAE